MGHSIGHWDPDTLAVDTVAFNDRSQLRIYAHTDWTVNMVWNLAPGGEEMLEYVCTENNRDVKHMVGK